MNLPNKISIGRIMIIPFFIAAVVYSRLDIALVLFIIAVISDGVDGMIARALKQKTRLGTVLDPIADKLLLVSAYICLAAVNHLPEHIKMPAYVPIVVISRDVIIVLGSLVVFFMTGKLDVKPSIAGKVTTFFQMMTIAGILVGFRQSNIVWNITTALTVVSGLEYVVKGSRLFGENHTNHGKAV